MTDIISKSTRNAFREVLVGYTLAEINTMFGNQDFVATDEPFPNITGERRTLVQQYYAGIDFRDLGQVRRLAKVYDDLVDKLIRMSSRRTWSSSPDPQIERQRELLAELLRKMERDGFKRLNERFEHQSIGSAIIHVQALTLSHVSVTEHVEKARAKIEAGDFSGAIASSYTLVEALQKALLRQLAPDFNENEGDIRQLYNLLKGPMNLDPKADTIDRLLKPIIDGFQKQIGGLFELANKASDRHARQYNPARHRAKLALNCAVTLCEFLLESFEHQRDLAKKRQTA